MATRSTRQFTASLRTAPPKSAKCLGAASARARIDISVYLKPRKSALAVAKTRGSTRVGLKSQRSTQHAGDIKLVRAFAKEHGLSVVSVEPARRLIRLRGTVAQMQTAFHTELSHYQEGAKTFRARTGTLSLPSQLAPIVESVLGLDTRPAASPRIIIPRAAADASYLPNEIAALYDFPTSVNGSGQCIALIELGGGFNASDTTKAFKAMGLTAPKVTAVSVDGGKNKPKPDDGANGEVALDIQVAGGGAPKAAIAVYFAPNTDAGFVDAISQAAHDSKYKPSVISISWGQAESQWTQQAVDSMNSALQDAASLGVSVFVASGDSLATDGVDDGKAHVDFPASSPWAIGCGGTNISVSGNAISSEVVWNDGTNGTGGGVSGLFTAPTFQKNVTLPSSGKKRQRGVPDVAGDAAPNTGYQIVFNNATQVVGGTSAVAPLWAGLTTLINQGAAQNVGFFLPTLYANPSWLRDITQGNNIPDNSKVGYRAGRGWDACTGLGVPNGQALFTALSASAKKKHSVKKKK